jgi:hypothetical protein
MDHRNPEDRKVLVNESALMKALDMLDELSLGISQEGTDKLTYFARKVEFQGNQIRIIRLKVRPDDVFQVT